MPGWDCHGLPIELKAVAEAKEQGRTQLTSTDIRTAARAVAYREMGNQRAQFADFAIMADWDDASTYRTMHFEYEAKQLALFARMVGKGRVKHHFWPVYWSPSSHTALAEAEIEYDEKHFTRSAYFVSTLRPNAALAQTLEAQLGSEANAIQIAVWTTTPWTLLGNMALAVHPDASYSVVRRNTGELLLVATELKSALETVALGRAVKGARTALGPTTEVLRLDGQALVGSNYHMDLFPPDASRLIVAAPFVTTDSGTGIVHMAPAHGQEDYHLWRELGRLADEGVVSLIDDYGRFALQGELIGTTPAIQAAVASLDGLDALDRGNKEVLALLDTYGMLLGELPYRHSYPIDWRTKQPLMVRATSQWFADLSDVGPAAQEALKDVTFVPATGRNRLTSLVGRRSEWCISRQRAWGVPLPAVYDKDTGEALLTERNIAHILSVFRTHNTMDVWWTLPPSAFVAPEYQLQGKEWMVKTDTLDVWFDSGSSWAVLQDARGAPLCTSTPCADVFLEGTDQHRGWFQSSLLTHTAVCDAPSAPYANLITHGFVVDSDGRKMSKSIGNVVSPHTFLHGDQAKGIAAFGTDVLRWWAAKADYTRDIPVSALIMKHASDEVRKLRNTARFLLANLGGVPRSVPLPSSPRLLDTYMLHELYQLDTACREAYAAYDFARVTRRLNEFVTGTLSSLYLDVAKDALYAGGPQRGPTLAVLDRTLDTLTSILAPILPHLAEEIYWYRQGHSRDPSSEAPAASFFQKGWADVEAAWADAARAAAMRALLAVRTDVFVLLTQCKEAQYVVACSPSLLKSAPECAVALLVPDTAAAQWAGMHEELADLFTVAAVDVYTTQADLEKALGGAAWTRSREGREATVYLTPSPLSKCPRCWKHQREAADALCPRCLGEVPQV